MNKEIVSSCRRQYVYGVAPSISRQLAGLYATAISSHDCSDTSGDKSFNILIETWMDSHGYNLFNKSFLIKNNGWKENMNKLCFNKNWIKANFIPEIGICSVPATRIQCGQLTHTTYGSTDHILSGVFM